LGGEAFEAETFACCVWHFSAGDVGPSPVLNIAQLELERTNGLEVGPDMLMG
jgi:hypothetical protein